MQICGVKKNTFAALRGTVVLLLFASISSAQTPTTADTIRFLEQSTFGPNLSLINHVQAIGFDAFLTEQFNTAATPISGYPNLALQLNTIPTTCTGICVTDNYSMYPLQVTFFTNALTKPDQLRQRVAFALQQILVTSGLTVTQPAWMTPYLNVFSNDAFANFRTILGDITLNPAMGSYLNMAGNNKNAPNENYGREVMQLFTIGLNMLNQDGSVIVDANNNPVPTYTQPTVDAFARVFTGWNLKAPAISGTSDYLDPMVVTASNHDFGAKTLLTYGSGPVVIPAVTAAASQTAAQATSELNIALDDLFNHPNVGPFIAKNLIEHLVTSNPSPAYVSRVSGVFNGNASGVRGDMQAVIRAILEDSEARSATPVAGGIPGHLTEPAAFVSKFLRLFNTTSATTDFVLTDGYVPSELIMGQNIFLSPSVFNYYPPSYTIPNTTINGPEFDLQSTSSAYARVNFVAETVYKTMSTTASSTTNNYRPTGTWIDFTSPTSFYVTMGSPSTPFAITGLLNTYMLHGAMSPSLHAVVNNALSSMTGSTGVAMFQRAVYLVASSPEYFVQQ
jgi:uncharacterized protein (DUF1800 family)